MSMMRKVWPLFPAIVRYLGKFYGYWGNLESMWYTDVPVNISQVLRSIKIIGV